jgi:hypothetical protein
MNPGEPVFDPGVVGGGDVFGMIKGADCDIYLVCFAGGHEGQGGAAVGAKGTQAIGPCENSRFTLSETKITPPERGPCDEWRAGAAPAIHAMAVCDVVGQAGCLVADGSAQTAAMNHFCSHA